jgi:6-pyruvoyltetrahydropterin/6-carboxytetrahydropterin synthase
VKRAGLKARPYGDVMFEVSVEESFAAGHALRGYKGKCENTHGHNYKVRLTLEGPALDQVGLLCDFVHVKRVMRAVIESLDHKYLNDMAPFDTVNPSAENIAKYFYEQTVAQMREHANGARISSVTVWETDTTAAVYRP